MQVFSVCGQGLLASIQNVDKGLSKNFCHTSSHAAGLSYCITWIHLRALDTQKEGTITAVLRRCFPHGPAFSPDDYHLVPAIRNRLSQDPELRSPSLIFF